MNDQPTPTDGETPSQPALAGNLSTPPLWIGELQRICAGLEAEMDGGFSPAARSHIRRLRAWTNMLHLDCANDAPSAIHPSQRQLPEPVLQALRFYAGRHHLVIDENEQEFESVSGEPVNWLMSTKDGDGTMVEDGSIARMALQGRSLDFEQDPGDGQPAFPQPVEGECFSTSGKTSPETENLPSPV